MDPRPITTNINTVAPIQRVCVEGPGASGQTTGSMFSARTIRTGSPMRDETHVRRSSMTASSSRSPRGTAPPRRRVRTGRRNPKGCRTGAAVARRGGVGPVGGRPKGPVTFHGTALPIDEEAERSPRRSATALGDRGRTWRAGAPRDPHRSPLSKLRDAADTAFTLVFVDLGAPACPRRCRRRRHQAERKAGEKLPPAQITAHRTAHTCREGTRSQWRSAVRPTMNAVTCWRREAPRLAHATRLSSVRTSPRPVRCVEMGRGRDADPMTQVVVRNARAAQFVPLCRHVSVPTEQSPRSRGLSRSDHVVSPRAMHAGGEAHLPRR